MYTAYPVFQDVKHYLGISNYADDALLVTLLKSAITMFENLCGRSFLIDTGTRYFSANDKDCVVKWNKLFLRDNEVLTVTGLEIDGAVVPTDEYYLEKGSYIMLKNTSVFSFQEFSEDPYHTIKVTGTWGYLYEVPHDVFWAIVRLTAYLYQQKDNTLDLTRSVTIANAGEVPSALPTDVLAVANIYRRFV